MSRSELNLAIKRQGQKIVRDEYGDKIRRLVEDRMMTVLVPIIDGMIEEYAKAAAKSALIDPYGEASRVVGKKVAELVDQEFSVRLVRKRKAKK
tara:strand:+ start:238 stop:519 length:282 start_codon:yes stop_codon:yes gene_type:complete